MTAVVTLAERKNRPALKSPVCCLRSPPTVGRRNEIITLATLWRPRAEEKLSGKSSLRIKIFCELYKNNCQCST